MEHIDPNTGEITEVEDRRLYGPARGRENPSPERLSMPSGFERPLTLQEQVQRLVRSSLSRYAEMQGFESFDEADDFDIEDEIEPHTPYEVFFDPVLGRDVTADQFRRNESQYRRLYAEKGQALTRAELFEALGVQDPVSTGSPEGVSPNNEGTGGDPAAEGGTPA